MFGSFSRSWEFASMSYRLIGENKKLIFFPIISSIAALLVTASFALPLWQTGQLADWWQFVEEQNGSQGDAAMYITAFLFYFCNYFAIVFFNTGLIACVLAIMNGEETSVSYGLSFAMKRLPQIMGWALVSAVIGVLLKVIERSHKRAGAFIASLLGSAWTALSYFVVPVIVVDGVGPLEAFKRSTKTLKSTWGTALMGNFSLGLFSFLIMLPACLIVFLLAWIAITSQSIAIMVTAGFAGIALFMIAAAVSTAADTIFKTYLYAYATGRTVPANIDTSRFNEAFRQKD